MAKPIPPQPQLSASFASRLTTATIRTRSVLCVGIDPHPSLMPALFGGQNHMPGSAQAIQHLEAFSQAIIEAATGLVPAIKPRWPFSSGMALRACAYCQI